MSNFKLNNIDPDDLLDFLISLEKSFDIKFIDKELGYIKTFGDLCDYIINKIQLENVDDCTGQQAFYKLRKAMLSVLGINNEEITRSKMLEDLLPEKTRRSDLKNLEATLEMKLAILTSPNWVTFVLIIY